MVLLPDPGPLVRRRVLYIGSAVPLDTATGLEALQRPLLERFPADREADIQGIDTNLSVSSSEIAMQYVDSSDIVIQFPISSLTMCAAVRCVQTTNAATGESGPRFVSLNDPLAGGENASRPALFAMITRRSQGRRVLECHGFICSSPRDAMELVKCTQQAGEAFKRSGTQRPQAARPPSGISTTAFTTADINQTSTLGRSVVNGAANGADTEPAMRLIPGEPVQKNVRAGPEFFEPVSKQGYFYSSNQAEVKRYNVHKVMNDEDKENIDIPVHDGAPRVANGYGPTLIRVGGPEPQINQVPPRVQYVAAQPPPHLARPVFYGPPPPPPPQPIFVRPRFFSPPPPRVRPMPYMMPPPPPPGPVYAPPIYVRRPRSGSKSGSRSSSRSKSPRQTTGPSENTKPKSVPNGDADTSSEGTLTKRPETPPTDYGKRPSGGRMSRRDQYEYRYRQESPTRYRAMDEVPPPFMYDYYVYPPRHGGYEPFMMYNPHARSRSLPPRGRSPSPHRKGKKKHRKVKKKKKSKAPVRADYGVYGYGPRGGGFVPRSDVSTDSHTGYHSELPSRPRPPVDTDSGYQFYPPRDFRRNENQFMNERNFSKSIFEETRRSRDSKSYPTAYELNEQLGRTARNDDVDFAMY